MKRPRVIVHNIASLDGKLTLAPDAVVLHGDERWQSVAESADEVFERLKSNHRPQVIVEGTGSSLTDKTQPEPLPPVEGDTKALYQDNLPDAVADRPGQSGWFAVVDARGRIRWVHKEWPGEEWAGWHVPVAVAQRTSPEYVAYLQREDIPFRVTGQERVDLGFGPERIGIRAWSHLPGVHCRKPIERRTTACRAGRRDR